MKATLKDSIGSDLDVVNAARVSFGKESKTLSEGDKRLIGFLARGCTKGDWDNIIEELRWTCYYDEDEIKGAINYIRRMPRHWTPFANGGTIKFHMKAPIFVARQLFKHQAGFEPPNEVSRRYVTEEPDFYYPKAWRKSADNVKQGSTDETTSYGIESYYDTLNRAMDLYKCMIDMGVCPEQARMVLPQSMYTEWVWKGNLYAWATLYNTRMDPHAQKETRDIVKQVGEQIEPLFPVSWEELTR